MDAKTARQITDCYKEELDRSIIPLYEEICRQVERKALSGETSLMIKMIYEHNSPIVQGVIQLLQSVDYKVDQTFSGVRVQW